MEKKERLPFGQWAENTWYYHKWQIILGALLVVFLIIATVQLIKESNPDVQMMYVGPWYLSAENQEQIDTAVCSLADDYNKDGQKKLSFLDLTISVISDTSNNTAVSYDDYNTTLRRFETEIRAGDTVIYFLHPEYYKRIKELEVNILCPLETILADDSISEDGYGITISKLDIYKVSGFSRMPEDTVVCIRQSPANDVIQYGRTVKNWEGNRDLFVKLVNYKDENAVS